MPSLPKIALSKVAILAAILLPGLAQAHAILEASTPEPNATIQPGPTDLQFRYNSRIDQGRSRLTLTRPDHTQSILPIEKNTPPDIIQAHLDLTPGAYSIRWQVLATDGHITRGDVPFTVRAP